jgi:hypothetical protein
MACDTGYIPGEADQKLAPLCLLVAVTTKSNTNRGEWRIGEHADLMRRNYVTTERRKIHNEKLHNL